MRYKEGQLCPWSVLELIFLIMTFLIICISCSLSIVSVSITVVFRSLVSIIRDFLVRIKRAAK